MLDELRPFEERDRQLESAARTIVTLCKQDKFGKGWRPKGVDEVAILLESLGYSQEVVQELWYDDLFAMASDVAELLERFISNEKVGRPPSVAWFVQAFKDYATGSLYSGPWLAAVIGLFVFGAAFWSSTGNSLALSTTASLGIFSSLVVSGFFSQAVARKLIFYYLQDNFPMIEWIMRRFMLRAVLALIVASAGLLVVLWGLHYDRMESVLGASFMLAAGLFQLSLGPLYTTRRFGWLVGVGAGTALATAAVYHIGFHGKVLEPFEPLAVAATVAVVGMAVMLFTSRWMHAEAQRTTSSGQLYPPSWWAITRSVRPYAIFGALYFAAIVVDHIGAGIVYGHGRYVYNPDYELGADLGLLAMVPLTGLINVILERLPPLLLEASTRYRIGAEATFNMQITRYFVTSLAAFAGMGVLSYFVLLPIGLHLIEHTAAAAGVDAHQARVVLYVAAPAYVLLMIALFSAQVLFFLSRPLAPLFGIVLAVCIVGGVSFAAVQGHASSIVPVYGLLAGMFAFCVTAVSGAYAAISRFAYSYYAAY
ncbi:MAG: hypothetical protein JOZ28_08655 [Candidatus Eremiobacteraeota bacterium]|nr:hypothetical protein [Candidatus Eremiobacteraeota bacterium]